MGGGLERAVTGRERQGGRIRGGLGGGGRDTALNVPLVISSTMEWGGEGVTEWLGGGKREGGERVGERVERVGRAERRERKGREVRGRRWERYCALSNTPHLLPLMETAGTVVP